MISSVNKFPSGLILFFVFILYSFIWLSSGSAEGVDLKIETTGNHHCQITRTEPGGFKVRTTGDDPYFFISPKERGGGLTGGRVLSFDYFSTSGSSFLQIFLTPNVSESRSVMAQGIGPSQGWSHYWVDLSKLVGKAGVSHISGFRLDPGRKSNAEFIFKNFQWRNPTTGESRILASKELSEKTESAAHDQLYQYLFHEKYPVKTSEVNFFLGDKRIKIEATTRLKDLENTYLVRFPFHSSQSEVNQGKVVVPFQVDDKGQFVYQKKAGKIIDEVLSKYAVVKFSPYGKKDPKLLSPFHYVDVVSPGDAGMGVKPRNKKGLGALSMGRPLSDIEELDVSAVTVNVVLSDFFNKSDSSQSEVFHFWGEEYYVSKAALERYDKIFKYASDHQLIVSVILLLPQVKSFRNKVIGNRLVHRDADPAGIFTMPATDTEQGIRDYSFIINLLAKRYNGDNHSLGKIHHWIIHNEVNSGWVWTNAGNKSALRYMNLYVKSMRLVQTIARIYNPQAKTFISLDHHWTSQHGDKSFPGKLLLDYLIQFSEMEGDFNWAVAHHPYPQSLFDPRSWNDTQIDFSFETPKITFKNIEVLVGYLKQDKFLHKGSVRAIHLSEQGLNSMSYSKKHLSEQAAGMAYAWAKIRNLKAIEVFHYHNWVDNRHEGGLKIGLRKFPDDPQDPLGKKPIWYLFQSLGSPGEQEAMNFALPIIGVEKWSDIP